MNSGNHVLAAAVILAVSVVASAFVMKTSMDSATEELNALRVAVEQTNQVFRGAAQPQPQRPAARRGPDPNKRYEIDITQAPIDGPDNAKVTIVEFSDFECPFCKRVNPTLKQVKETYGDDVRVAFKHFPLPIHPRAPGAARAAVAADRQGKFWEMHDLLFENQRDLNEEAYLKYAADLGMNVDQFKSDMASDEVKKLVESDTQQAGTLEVGGTPGFFINGRWLSGAQPFAAFKQIIDEELKVN